VNAALNAQEDVAVSLVVATLGRTWQVERLFHSLAAQRGVTFDVVVVDQNDDDRLLSVLQQKWPFAIRHMATSGERGASRARNRGWRAARGAVILFPDDDCWYPPNFLETALATMRERGSAVLSGRPTDETGRTINGRFEVSAQPIDVANVWTTAIEWMVFFERAVLSSIDGFDEDIGIGAATPWQSSEIQDIILRSIRSGYSCWYDPAITGYHEEMVIGRPDAKLLRKARGYARGMGFVLHAHGYSIPRQAIWVGRPIARAVVSLFKGRRDLLPYYSNVAIGRLEGALRRTFLND
jgi:glycosyltransferase involved in cell wall biosynthesis